MCHVYYITNICTLPNICIATLVFFLPSAQIFQTQNEGNGMYYAWLQRSTQNQCALHMYVNSMCMAMCEYSMPDESS